MANFFVAYHHPHRCTVRYDVPPHLLTSVVVALANGGVYSHIRS